MGFLSGLVQGVLNLMQKYDPIDSALLNGMIDLGTIGVRETMNSSKHFFDAVERNGPGFLRGLAGGLKNNSEHWSIMAQRAHDDHARFLTNAGLTLAALYGGYYGYANPGTIGGSFGSGYAAGSGAAAAAGADQDQIAKAGLIGGASSAAGQYAGAETGSPAIGGATQGAVGAGLNGGNIGRGAITGGLSAGMPDVGSQVGIENPELNKAFNNTLKSGLVARANGGDARSNMLGAGVTGLAGYGASLMDNNEYGSGYDPIKASAGSYSSPAPWASGLGGGNTNYTPTPWSTQGGGYTPTEGGAQPQGNPVKDMFKQGLDYGRDMLSGVSDFTGINRSNFGNVAEGLAGLYQGYQQRKQARDLQTMMGMRRQAYEQQLRKNLMARDAAAGKRSDYGGRETQLMSSLAELDARNAPAMMGLSNMQLGGGLGMLQSGLRLGGKMGWLDTGTQPNLSPMQMPTLATLPYIRPSYNTLDATSNDPMNWDRMRRPDQFGQ